MEVSLGVHMCFGYVSVGSVEIINVWGFGPLWFLLHHSLQLVSVYCFIEASFLFGEGYICLVVLELSRHIWRSRGGSWRSSPRCLYGNLWLLESSFEEVEFVFLVLDDGLDCECSEDRLHHLDIPYFLVLNRLPVCFLDKLFEYLNFSF